MKKLLISVFVLVLILMIFGCRRSSPTSSNLTTAHTPTTVPTNTPTPIGKVFALKGQALAGSACLASGGGYVIAGITKGVGYTDWYTFLLKVDLDGNQVWTKYFVAETNNYNGTKPCSLQPTSDGGYVLLLKRSNGLGLTLFKLDSAGTVQWRQYYWGILSNTVIFYSANSVKQTLDGGYILTGVGEDSIGTRMVLVKTDSNGNPQWATFPSSAGAGKDVLPMSDGSYLLGTSYNIGLINTDSSGNYLSQNCNIIGYLNRFNQTNDGGYVVVGATGWYGEASSSNLIVIKTDSSRNVLWAYYYTGLLDSYGTWAEGTSDGGFIVTGYNGVDINATYQSTGSLYLVKLDSSGSVSWSNSFQRNGYASYGVFSKETSDGGFFAAGSTGMQVFLVKTDASGNELW